MQAVATNDTCRKKRLLAVSMCSRRGQWKERYRVPATRKPPHRSTPQEWEKRSANS